MNLLDKWTAIQRYLISALKEARLSDCEKIYLNILPTLTRGKIFFTMNKISKVSFLLIG